MTSAGTLNQSWIYYKVYVGRAVGRIDYLITDTVPTICRHDGIARWFFIRYSDHGGSHLRLRLKPLGEASDLRRAAETVINQTLRALPRIPPPIYRPVVSQRDPDNLKGIIQVIEGEYKPEINKFGPQGIFVAERLFQLSSESAVETLISERVGVCSRKSLIPIFMEAVRKAFIPIDQTTFWANYSNYWLQLSGVSVDDWLQRFSTKSKELRERNVEILAQDALLPLAIQNIIGKWREGLCEAARIFQRLEERTSIGLAFQFIHLMNNRLGVSPIEEAYFSFLLQDG